MGDTAEETSLLTPIQLLGDRHLAPTSARLFKCALHVFAAEIPRTAVVQIEKLVVCLHAFCVYLRAREQNVSHAHS